MHSTRSSGLRSGARVRLSVGELRRSKTRTLDGFKAVQRTLLKPLACGHSQRCGPLSLPSTCVSGLMGPRGDHGPRTQTFQLAYGDPCVAILLHSAATGVPEWRGAPQTWRGRANPPPQGILGAVLGVQTMAKRTGGRECASSIATLLDNE